MVTFNVRLDKQRLQQLMRNAPQRADDAIEAAARDGQAYVMDSFTTSPSSPGEPPGVDTGTLKNSIMVIPRGLAARSIITGVEYAPHLEFGTTRMAARPFMLPMALWLEGEMPRFFERFAAR